MVDPVHNALLDIAEQPQRAQPIPDTSGTLSLQADVLSPRVAKNMLSPRVEEVNVSETYPLTPAASTQQSPTIAKLQRHSNQLKN